MSPLACRLLLGSVLGRMLAGSRGVAAVVGLGPSWSLKRAARDPKHVLLTLQRWSRLSLRWKLAAGRHGVSQMAVMVWRTGPAQAAAARTR